MSLVIRNSEIADFDAIFGLFGQLWPDRELHESQLQKIFLKGIQSDVDEYLSAVLDGNVVGFCSYSVVNSFWQEGCMAYVHELVVNNLHRSQGLGTMLLNAAVNNARLKNCRKIELDSAFPREKAHLFYENNGFIKRAYLFLN